MTNVFPTGESPPPPPKQPTKKKHMTVVQPRVSRRVGIFPPIALRWRSFARSCMPQAVGGNWTGRTWGGAPLPRVVSQGRSNLSLSIPPFPFAHQLYRGGGVSPSGVSSIIARTVYWLLFRRDLVGSQQSRERQLGREGRKKKKKEKS